MLECDHHHHHLTLFFFHFIRDRLVLLQMPEVNYISYLLAV